MNGVFTQLAQETLDEIVDYVHTFGFHELATCALIHPSFVPRSQLHLFSTIHIGGVRATKRRERIKEFRRILKRKPYLVQFVKELRLSVAGTSTVWLTYDKDFIPLLNLLLDLGCAPRKLVIVKANTKWAPGIYDPNVFAKQMARLTPSVQSLELGEIEGIPTSFIASCVNLDILVLRGSSFVCSEFTEDLPAEAFLLRPSIRQLIISGIDKTFPDLFFADDERQSSPILDVSELHTFKFSIGYDQKIVEMASRVMCVANKNLESLFISFNWNQFANFLGKSSYKDINLRDFKSLRNLEVEVLTPVRYVVDELAAAIETIPRGCPIESVKFHVGPHYPSRWTGLLMQEANWKRLDKAVAGILTGSGVYFGFLLSCEERLKTPATEEKINIEEAAEEWERDALDRMPRTASLTGVEVSFKLVQVD
ncbi:hypothetical protein GALMADRAFT_1328522 [Galerina marginata CBS 339.88]|uniref:F-box domain-containing protein n=1 Tax=Galerina marginata (strain CBS 339.88) TaxID=685588 RepID=A0A067T2T9_GALM3|nr:hypothetical protein GALMADRAFT_1328522 [Galerina marginata CBS 339.88]